MQFTDAVPFSGTRRTTDGYLVVDAKAVRTGIQLYAGSEVGRPDLAVVRVYRSADEVRSADSLRSFSHAPITVDHPAVPVTAENWKDLSVGEVSTSATWDGNRIALPLILKDAAAIRLVEAGKRELSAGYTCDLDPTPGVTADGQAFDAQQKNIRANHLAIVTRGRAGPECRIGDAEPSAWGAAPISPNPQPLRDAVPMKMHTVDGHSVELNDAAAIAVASLRDKLAVSVADNLRLSGDIGTLKAEHTKALTAKDEAHTKALATADAAHADVVKAKDTELATKDAEIERLKANQIDDAKIDALAAERGEVIGTAKTVLDAARARGVQVGDLRTAGVPLKDIRRSVVGTVLGDAAIKDKSDSYVDVRFDILAEDAAKRPDALGQAVRSVVADTRIGDSRSNAYAAMVGDLTSAWQAKPAA